MQRRFKNLDELINRNKMKKMSFLKEIAAFALVFAAIGCSHDDDLYDQTSKEEESASQFKNNVLGGQEVDANQTWSTAVTSTVSVNVNLDYGQTYKVYVFTTNPLLNKEAKYIGMGSVESGKQLDMTVARPVDVTTFFAACVDKKGAYSVQRFEFNGTKASVNIGNTVASARKAAPRRVSITLNPGQWNASTVSTNPADYLKDGDYFIDDMLNYNNNWAGYYDLSLVDAQYYDKLCYGINNEMNNGNVPLYGDGKHFIVPAGKSVEGSIFNWNDGGGNDHIIVVAGTLTINGDCRFDNGKSLVVAAGGKLILNGQKLEVTNSSRLMNYGELAINGTYVDFTNGTPKGFYNGGTIKGKNGAVMNFAGGWNGNESTYYNAGRIDLGDGAFQFNATAFLINNGHMKAASGKKGATRLSDLSASAQNGIVYNLCDMDIDMYGVNFYVGCDGSLLHCAEGLMTNYSATVVLGKQAMIHVKDMYSNGAHYYASGSSSDYAVLKVTGGVDEQNAGNMTTGGYFYFDVNDVVGKDAWHIENFKNKMEYSVSEATAPDNITIPADADGCNSIGYNSNVNGGGGDDFSPNYVYYAFEDLGSIGDFDFNDVVVRVSTPVDGISTVEILAAGGTMETYVTYGTGDKPARLGAEVHAALGESSISKMINTWSADASKFTTLSTIEVGADADLTMLPLGIEVNGSAGGTVRVTRSMENNGRAPLVIVVNGNDEGKWFWPTEVTNITVAYEDFGAWGADVTSNPDWYRNPTGAVVSY